jgi:hypothetical protein
VSFFDEDDEPLRTTPRPRPRPRRGSPAGGAAADQQQIYVRRAVFGLLIVLVVVLLGLFVKSCSDSRAKQALRDYNTKVSALAGESQNTGVSFFKHFAASQPSATQLQTAINSDKATADTTLKQARQLDVPDEMVPAQQSLLIALELRRDALDQVAQNIRTALGDSGEQADQAIKNIAGQMAALNASDVLFSARVDPLIKKVLDDKQIGSQTISSSQFVKDVSWLSPEFVAQKLDQQLTSGNASGNGGTSRQPTGPGLHGTGLNSTSVGTQTLTPGAPNQITYTPGMIFFVSFTNQGDNDEFNIKVTLRIEGSSGSPITLTANVPSAPKGSKQTAQLKLNRTPPIGSAVTIAVNVAAVPGEKKTDNNKSSYPALFKR